MNVAFQQVVFKRGFMSSLFRSLCARFAFATVLAVMMASMAQAQTCAPQPGVIPGVPCTKGYMATVAGSNVFGYSGDGGLATSAELKFPYGVALDAAGNLYIVDQATNNGSSTGYIRMVNAQSGKISTVAGGGNSQQNPNGKPAVEAFLASPEGIAVDPPGNIYIADYISCTIDEVSATTGIISVVAGAYQSCLIDNASGDGVPATSAVFSPAGVALDNAGNVYIADSYGSTIRKVDSSQTIHVIAGSIGNTCSDSACGDGGSATSALLNKPSSVTLDSNGNIYIVDAEDYRVRVVYEKGATTACLIALENPGFSLGGATDCSGATPPTPTPSPVVGNIYNLAGNGVSCFQPPCGDGGPANQATLVGPYGVTVDGSGNVFISDPPAIGTIWEVSATTGIISAIANNPNNVSQGYSGPGPVLATNALLGGPQGIAFDSFGNLFIADSSESVVMAIADAGAMPQQTPTITFPALSPSSLTYGQVASLNASSNSSGAITYAATGSATVTGSAPDWTLTMTGTGAGTVTATVAAAPPYGTGTSQQSFTVSPATLTIAANNINVTYGAAPASLSFGFTADPVGTDTVTGMPSYAITSCSDGNPTYTATTSVGTVCTITPGLGSLKISPSASNYNIIYQAGTLTVTGGGTQIINFPSLPSSTLTYGTAPIPLKATATSGLPVSYTASGSAVVTGSASTGYSLTFTGVGPGTVTANQAGNNDFSAATPATQAFNVTPAIITVTATNVSKPYGAITPSQLQYTISPTTLFNGDVLTGTPALSTTATNTSPVGGTFPISAAQGTLSISPVTSVNNYSFNFVNGMLTIATGTNAITFPAIPNSSYGSTVLLTATASSGLPVTYTLASGPATLNGSTLSLTGVGPVTVTANQAGNSNYATATPVAQSFTATQAVLTVQPVSVNRAEGADNPVFTYTVIGFVNGDGNSQQVLQGAPLITTTATPASAPGAYPITPTIGTLQSTNYTFNFANGVLTVFGAPSYVLTANPATITVQQGQSVQTTLQLNPINNYQGSVALSCGQLPPGLTCTFSPAALNLAIVGNSTGTNSVLGTLTITTNGQAPQAKLIRDRETPVYAASIFFVPGGLSCLLLVFNRKRLAKHGKAWVLLAVIGLGAAVMGFNACGGSATSLAPPGANTITITTTGTGTSGTGSPNMTTSITLTVNVMQ